MTSTIFGREVTAILFAIRSIILCFIAFGLSWTGDQVAATMLAVEAVLLVIGRQNVTPNATLRDAKLDPFEVKQTATENRTGTGDGGIR